MLVGVSVGCLMGCFRAPPPWRKTAPLKRPIKRSMTSEFPEFWKGEEIRSVEKRGYEGGWREEILPIPEIQTSFLCPLSYATPRRRGTHFWGSIFWCVLGPVGRQPPPADPFSCNGQIVGKPRKRECRQNV